MKRKQMQEEIKNYLLMVRADRKKAGITKVPEFDERDIELAYGNGLKSGLWHHSHDYLVKTAGIKEKYKSRITDLEAQIEEMKSDVRANIKWADQNKNEQMYCKLNAMINQWEIKEK